MKVSRKLGRRKHSRSSFVSRRRLRNKKSRSGYKKRYAKTQRGGGRSRSKYGHKRGKRFHRGGNEFNCDEFSKTFKKFSNPQVGPNSYYQVDSHSQDTYNNHDSYKNHQFKLTFKKIDTFSFTNGEEMFALKVELYPRDVGYMQIVLERVTGSSHPPSFMFEGQLEETLDRFEDPRTWNNITEHGGSRKYNFNLGSNVATFIKIGECVRSLEENLSKPDYGLQANWVPLREPISDRLYYGNTLTKETTWNRPSIPPTPRPSPSASAADLPSNKL